MPVTHLAGTVLDAGAGGIINESDKVSVLKKLIIQQGTQIQESQPRVINVMVRVMNRSLEPRGGNTPLSWRSWG